jgi:hypothetical protein
MAPATDRTLVFPHRNTVPITLSQYAIRLEIRAPGRVPLSLRDLSDTTKQFRPESIELLHPLLLG